MARQMKDSGIEWIGEIPETWTISKNKYLLDSMYSGGTPSASNSEFYAEAEGTPFVSISDMSATDYVLTTKKSLTPAGIADKGLLVLPAGTVLYSIYATVGAVSELAIDATISQAMLALTVKQDVDKQYYKYCLFAMKDYIFGSANGNTQFNLNAEKVWNFVFPKPCTPEQHRIAAFLDHKCAEIDAVIERTKATIEEYKKLKQAVITEAVTKGVRGERKMKDSGIVWIGEIPEGWEVRKCKHISAFINGYAFDSADLVIDFRYPVIRIGDIKSGFVDFEHCQGVQWNQGLDNYKIQTNDILLAMSGATVGKVGLATPTNDSYINQRVGILRSNCYKYLFYALSTDFFIEYILLKASGSAQPNVSGIVCGNFPLPYPPDDEREEITVFLDEKCAALDTLIAKKTALLTELETYKKSLIYEYVTGKKEVPACP